jgi:hypothetical protein
VVHVTPGRIGPACAAACQYAAMGRSLVKYTLFTHSNLFYGATIWPAGVLWCIYPNEGGGGYYATRSLVNFRREGDYTGLSEGLRAKIVWPGNYLRVGRVEASNAKKENQTGGYCEQNRNVIVHNQLIMKWSGGLLGWPPGGGTMKVPLLGSGHISPEIFKGDLTLVLDVKFKCLRYKKASLECLPPLNR